MHAILYQKEIWKLNEQTNSDNERTERESRKVICVEFHMKRITFIHGSLIKNIEIRSSIENTECLIISIFSKGILLVKAFLTPKKIYERMNS